EALRALDPETRRKLQENMGLIIESADEVDVAVDEDPQSGEAEQVDVAVEDVSRPAPAPVPVEEPAIIANQAPDEADDDWSLSITSGDSMSPADVGQPSIEIEAVPAEEDEPLIAAPEPEPDIADDEE